MVTQSSQTCDHFFHYIQIPRFYPYKEPTLSMYLYLLYLLFLDTLTSYMNASYVIIASTTNFTIYLHLLPILHPLKLLILHTYYSYTYSCYIPTLSTYLHIISLFLIHVYIYLIFLHTHTILNLLFLHANTQCHYHSMYTPIVVLTSSLVIFM